MRLYLLATLSAAALTASLATPAAAQVSSCAIGQRVSASFMGSNYSYNPGTVIALRPGECHVHFDDHDASYEAWVVLAKVRPLAATGAPPAPASPGQPSPPPPQAAAAGTERPPCRVGSVTRAGALNYDAKILQYSAAKGLYQVRYINGYPGDEEWLPARGLKSCQGIDAAAVPLSFFAGTWDLFNGGGGAWMKSTKRDWHVGRLDAAHAPPITLTGDGRYTWVLDSKTTIRGQWRAAQKSELKDGYEKLGTAILLLNGESDKNWLVTRQLVGTDDGRDRILIERVDLGLTYRGGRVK
jgi:hypothetical protein